MANKTQTTLAFLLAALLLILSGCGEPTIDASSEDRMKESIREVKNSLPKDRHDDLEDALELMMFADMDNLAYLADSDGMVRRFQDRIDGLTADELFLAAEEVQAEREARERATAEQHRKQDQQRAQERREREEQRAQERREQEEQRAQERREREEQRAQERREQEEQHAQERREQEERERQQIISEIEELAAKLRAVRHDVLATFTVERSRFGYNEDGTRSSRPHIELAVHNGTEHAVSRVQFDAMLVTPGRALPWVDSGFSYRIPGGLEPGESATWNLRPNMFGEWSNAPMDRDDTIIIVRPTALEGPDGESFVGEGFSDHDENKLVSRLESIDWPGEHQVRALLEAHHAVDQKWLDSAEAEATRAEAAYLRQQKTEAQIARELFELFVVEQSRFYWHENGFTHKPTIDLTLHNGTGQAVSRVYARGILSSPERETPWVDEEFNYIVSGGIEAGETKQIGLHPNLFGGWDRAPHDRTDLVLTVEIVGISDADGNALYDEKFTDLNEQRLNILEAMIKQNNW